MLIEGHSDERGTREYNIALSASRATSVTNYLTSLGIAGSRLRTIAYGKERPAEGGSDDESWAANRRAVAVPSGPGA
jgi:peptidoglycan-associated lipoprotein